VEDSIDMLVEALGIKLVEVDGLPSHVCFVPTQRVGLIRRGLPPADWRDALDFLVLESCRGSGPDL